MSTNKKDSIIMIVIVVVLAAIAIPLVVYGVTQNSETEPGLVPDAPRWAPDRLPVGVCVIRYSGGTVLEPGDRSAVDHAVSITDGRLGFGMYELTTAARSDCPVVITLGVPAEPGWTDPGGTARLMGRDGVATRCEIETSNVFGELQQLTLQHELGHCMGLAHDDFERSIMRREQSETPDRALPPWISDHDRSLLREIYASS